MSTQLFLIETQAEKRVRGLEQQIGELNALICGQRLVIDRLEAENKELQELLDQATKLHVCEQPEKPKRK